MGQVINAFTRFLCPHYNDVTKQEINALKTQVEAAKYEVIKYGLGNTAELLVLIFHLIVMFLCTVTCFEQSIENWRLFREVFFL